MDKMIYGLTCNNTGKVFYVGQTKYMHERFLQHKRKFGNNISYIVLDIVDISNANEVEAYWISYYMKRGYNILNKRWGIFTHLM